MWMVTSSFNTPNIFIPHSTYKQINLIRHIKLFSDFKSQISLFNTPNIGIPHSTCNTPTSFPLFCMQNALIQHTKHLFSLFQKQEHPHSTHQSYFILILKAKNILIQHTKYLYSLHILLASQHHSTHQTSFSDSVTTISSFYTLNIFVLIRKAKHPLIQHTTYIFFPPSKGKNILIQHTQYIFSSF